MARVAALTTVKTRQRMTARQWREARAFYILVSPFVIGFLAVTLVPMIVSFLLSFAQWDLINPPKWVGFTNYNTLVTNDPDFVQGIKVTLSYAAGFLPLSLIFSLVVALLMNQNIRGVNTFRAIYYMPSLLAGFSTAALWVWVFDDQQGILNRVFKTVGLPQVGWLTDPTWALRSFMIMGLWGIGNTVLIYLAGLKGIPRQLYEAAAIDGAGWWPRFRNVTIPMLTPTIFFNFLTGMIGVFQYFSESYVLTNGGPDVANYQAGTIVGATRFYMLKLYNDAFKVGSLGYASAQAVMLFLFIMVLTIIVVRTSRSWVYYEGSVVTGK